MTHLTINAQSHTFAVAIPCITSDSPNKLNQSLLNGRTEVVVFYQDLKEPIVTRRFNTLITAIVPMICSSGYLILDAEAQIHPLIPRGSQAITSLAQSTSALHLDSESDDEAETAAGDLLRLVENGSDAEISDAEAMDEDNEGYAPPTPTATHDSVDDDENEMPVVTVQQLSQVFDVGPAFAMPSMEELFMQVVGLYEAKPLPRSS